MITFFDSFRLRHSQFRLVTRKSSHTQVETAPIQFCALFEPKDNFKTNDEVSALIVLFDFIEEVIPIAIGNRTEEEITMYRNTTLGSSEIVPEALINGISK